MQNDKPNSRAVAAQIIGEWMETGAFPDHLIESVGSDRAFVMEVVYGVIRWKRALEWVVKRLANRNPDKELMPFLFVGLYQILVMDKVEEYAAVNETVEAVKAAGMPHVVSFSNAVFRSALREHDLIHEELEKQPLGVRLSHPDVFISRWKKQYGEEKMIKLLDWNNSRPAVIIRPNRIKISFEEYVQMLKTAGIEAEVHPFLPGECLSLARGATVTELPGYSDGLFTVQDPSTLVSVKLLDPQPGEFVLDACAAPGGKTSVIAEKMGGKGRIVAMDIQVDRLDTLKENLARMGIKSVTLAQGDAASEADMQRVADGREFDRILLDVPCTNTGVLRRRPDARWRFTNRGQTEILGVQRQILANTAKFVKPGGVLVYSTCSLEDEEDDGIIDSWLSANPGFEKAGREKIFPPDSLTDGAYACALRRRT